MTAMNSEFEHDRAQAPNLVLSGMQPTNTLHLGNYLGALKNWVKIQDQMPCLYCVVDMHAHHAGCRATAKPKELAQATREVAAAYIAAGVDPKRAILFNQSQVPEHAELAWIFNCVARLGWLDRMTQFKEKSGKHKERSSVGLYTYPVLMAADILVYKATHVPVGEDQKPASRADARHRAEVQQRFRRAGFLPAARAGDHGHGDARDEPARRHEEDVEVGRVRLFAHQPDRRCRRHRAEDPQGQDRSQSAAGFREGIRGPAGSGEPDQHLCGAGRRAARDRSSRNSRASNSPSSRTSWRSWRSPS